MTITDTPSGNGHAPDQSDRVHGEPVPVEPVPVESVPGESVPVESVPSRPADLSVWMIWAAVMLVAIAILPFAARSQDVVRAIATMCGVRLD